MFEQSLWHAVPAVPAKRRCRAAPRRGARTAARRGADSLRVVDWRRPRRQPERDARGHAQRVPARAMAGGGPLSARDQRASRRAVDVTARSPELAALAGDAREPYRALLRDVRTRLLATREWVEAALREDVAAAGRRLPRGGGAGGAAAALSPVARGDRRRGNRERTTGGCAAARRDVRRHAGAARHPAGIRSSHCRARRDHGRRAGSAPYAEWDEPRRVEFLAGELDGVASAHSG